MQLVNGKLIYALEDFELINACRRYYGAGNDNELIKFGAVIGSYLAENEKESKRYEKLQVIERKMIESIESSTDTDIYYMLVVKIINEFVNSAGVKPYSKIVGQYFEFVYKLKSLFRI